MKKLEFGINEFEVLLSESFVTQIGDSITTKFRASNGNNFQFEFILQPPDGTVDNASVSISLISSKKNPNDFHVKVEIPMPPDNRTGSINSPATFEIGGYNYRLMFVISGRDNKVRLFNVTLTCKEARGDDEAE